MITKGNQRLFPKKTEQLKFFVKGLEQIFKQHRLINNVLEIKRSLLKKCSQKRKISNSKSKSKYKTKHQHNKWFLKLLNLKSINL